MRILYSLLLICAAALSTYAQGDEPPPPVRVPTESCNGCSATATVYAPDTAEVEYPLGGGCESFPVTWTIRREIAMRGYCNEIDGTCFQTQGCTALAMLIGSYEAYGFTDEIDLRLEVNTCGTSEEESESLGDSSCLGSDSARITAECTACLQ